MVQPNIFDATTHVRTLERLALLQSDATPQWGTMTPAQMCAHVCVSYEYIFGDRNDVPPLFMRLLLRLFFRGLLVGNKPYPKGAATAPSMIINNERNLDTERARLVAYIERVYAEGAHAFEGRPQVSLGPLTAVEWSTLLYKHLDHHLRQFGV